MCDENTIQLISPLSTHGFSVSQLVASCPPLDNNSIYCNLLQCSHFSDTSVAALRNNELVGFVSGYRIPARPQTLFVWQVAVSEDVRGQGLATRMIEEIIGRSACKDIRFIETTITPDNQGSWRLFRALAERLDSTLSESLMFDRNDHFQGLHDSEVLVKIGPFQQNELNNQR